jgi:hypothetical protein
VSQFFFFPEYAVQLSIRSLPRLIDMNSNLESKFHEIQNLPSEPNKFHEIQNLPSEPNIWRDLATMLLLLAIFELGKFLGNEYVKQREMQAKRDREYEEGRKAEIERQRKLQEQELDKKSKEEKERDLKLASIAASMVGKRGRIQSFLEGRARVRPPQPSSEPKPIARIAAEYQNEQAKIQAELKAREAHIAKVAAMVNQFTGHNITRMQLEQAKRDLKPLGEIIDKIMCSRKKEENETETNSRNAKES